MEVILQRQVEELKKLEEDDAIQDIAELTASKRRIAINQMNLGQYYKSLKDYKTATRNLEDAKLYFESNETEKDIELKGKIHK